MLAKIRKLNKYRYQIVEKITVPIVSDRLKKALSDTGLTVNHPYYSIDSSGVTANDLYAWDGVTGAINTKNLRIASLIHDIGCQAVNDGRLPKSFRSAFDREYYEQAELYGVNKLRRILHYIAIRIWGMIPIVIEREHYSNIYSIKIEDKWINYVYYLYSNWIVTVFNKRFISTKF